MSRAVTPRPAAVGSYADRGIEPILDGLQAQLSSVHATTIRGADQPPAGTFSRIISEITIENSWAALKRIIIRLLGTASFALGVAVGIGEDLVSSVIELLNLIRIFVLADLYDLAHERKGWGLFAPMTVSGLLAQAANSVMPETLKKARDQRNALVDEVKQIFADPRSFFRSIKDEYVHKFERYAELAVKEDLTSHYEAGKIFGSLLLDVVALIAGGEALAKAVTKLPELFKLAESLKGKLPGLSRVATEAKVLKQEAGPLWKAAPAASEVLSRVSTKPSEAFFWSGKTDGIGGAQKAAELAKANKGTTLEALIDERGIEMPSWDPENPSSIQAWRDLSQAYAQNASGKVRAVIGESLRPGNIWEDELNTLKSNPNVTEIIQIDPKTGVETSIFKR